MENPLPVGSDPAYQFRVLSVKNQRRVSVDHLRYGTISQNTISKSGDRRELTRAPWKDAWSMAQRGVFGPLIHVTY